MSSATPSLVPPGCCCSQSVCARRACCRATTQCRCGSVQVWECGSVCTQAHARAARSHAEPAWESSLASREKLGGVDAGGGLPPSPSLLFSRISDSASAPASLTQR
eukprot:365372-Chlamydomonas_euryale.AAC.7